MSRPVKFAVIQPPPWVAPQSGKTVQSVGLELFDEALTTRPDVICLPEYFNCMGVEPAAYETACGCDAGAMLSLFAGKARSNRCHVILPMVVTDGAHRFNRAYVLNREGNLAGHFDKVHPTAVEQEEMGVIGGKGWPVFDLDIGCAGIMICYDGCFPESPRSLALAGARIIFWPSLQRSYTQNELELQMRGHAYFNFATVVRSSYGGPLSGEPGVRPMVGHSGICDNSGAVVTSICGQPGWRAATVDMADERRGQRTFGGEVGNLRQMQFEDRRPNTYDLLTRPYLLS